MEYPRIYLAVDNCFASKRWTMPSRWMKLAQKIGINYVEASADNECDPLYMDQKYLDDWVEEVKRMEKETGVKVINLYSGHGTYSTLGLAHYDERIRNRMQKEWLEKMIGMSAKLDAGLGFFCHAFSQRLLRSPKSYSTAREELYSRLAELSVYASKNGVCTIGVEQMYTPHQIPWTITGSKDLINQVYSKSGKDFYITIDTGHQSGQRKFLRPNYVQIKEALRTFRDTERVDGFWIGPRSAWQIFKGIARNENSKHSIENIVIEMDKYPYLFAAYEDGDPYQWLEQLGCFSPIIHLQQTSGDSSSHLAFNEKNNAGGIIKGDKVLQALAKSYSKEHKSMPKTCENIFLTLEIFSVTSELPVDIINKLKDSVAYWRKFIPEDGIRLDKLI